MHLYLVRHAHAIDGENDALRPLSPKGLGQIRTLTKVLRRADAVVAEEVWHSPLVRARDTAERLAKRLRLKAKFVETDGLKPGDAPERLARRLAALRHPVMIVGHEPHLGALATLLLTGRAEPSRVVMKKCAVLRLDRENGGWSVRWLLSPEIA